jgi:hypothetical protein
LRVDKGWPSNSKRQTEAVRHSHTIHLMRNGLGFPVGEVEAGKSCLGPVGCVANEAAEGAAVHPSGSPRRIQLRTGCWEYESTMLD